MPLWGSISKSYKGDPQKELPWSLWVWGVEVAGNGRGSVGGHLPLHGRGHCFSHRWPFLRVLTARPLSAIKTCSGHSSSLLQ